MEDNRRTTTATDSQDVLLMFSGGRDSFLSACYLVEKGYRVHLITYDNGSMSGVESVRETATRIIGKYGPERVLFSGILGIVTDLYRLQEGYLYKTPGELSKDFPHLLPYQARCLTCHTAMYVESIAYCRQHGIKNLAEGARESQRFFVELPIMASKYKELAEEYDIQLHLPVYNLKNDWDRKLQMGDRGFRPKTYEFQCWLGCPMRESLSQEQIDSLALYYDCVMKPLLKDMIDNKFQLKNIEANEARFDRYEI